MKRNAILLLAVISVLFLFIIQSSSFVIRNWPDVGVPEHHAIVRDAMLLMGNCPQSSLDILMAGAEEPDGTAPVYFTDRWPKWAHLLGEPGESFGSVWDTVAENRNLHLSIAVAYAQYSDLYSREACLRNIGNNDHTIADFYAHTNWVENRDPLATVNFLAADPPSGIFSGGGTESKDSPGNVNFKEAYDDAVLSTIWHWNYFEDLMIAAYGNTAAAYYMIHNLQIASGLKMYFPRHDTHIYAWDYIAPGYNLGTTQTIKWNHCALPHDSTITLRLWKDNTTYIGDITATPVDIHNREFVWTVGYCANGAVATYDNYVPHYEIEIVTTTPFGTFSDNSIHFYILNPTTGTAKYLAADSSAWNDIQLTWFDVSSSETGYGVYRRKESDADFSLLKTVGANVTSTHDTTAVADTVYYYRVRTIFPGGTYATTDEAHAEVKSIRPDPPSLINVWHEPNKNRFKLAWNNTSCNEQGFKIERKFDWDPAFYEVGTVGPNVSYFYDYVIPENPGGYADLVRYRIKAYNPAGYLYSLEVEIPIHW